MKVIVSGVILGFKIGGCGTIRDYNDFEFGCSVYSQSRLGLGGAGAQQKSPDHYSCVGANFHKSYMDQGDHWVIKFRSGLNLFDLIKL